MSVKETAKRHYRTIIDGTGQRFDGMGQPKEGWIASFRKALGMSGPQLASRAGVTKAAIYQAERKELAGEITVKQLEKIASALGGRLVYAIVPEDGSIDDVITRQAERRASAIMNTANTHMALEAQSISEDAKRQELAGLVENLKRNPPSDFWEGS